MRWSSKRCVVLDMDGTVYLGNIPIQGSVRFIQNHWKDIDFYFLTNNTSKSLSTYVTKLKSMGIPAEREILLSPVLPLVNFLRERQIQRIYLVGNRDFARELHEKMPDLQECRDNVQAVVLAYDTELTYEKLATSALLLQKQEVLFLATHPDLVCPSPEGPLPDVGSFLKLYAAATGRQPQYIFGKPDPLILQPLLAKYAREDMVMVGDRLSTDKKLAENAGIDFALVLSGEAKREDLEGEERKPTVILQDLGEAEKDFG
ncbi:MAG: HAD-IIA family hydrolase [Desulfovibrio sp.]|nr:HAD-IIA family hydrolase [Desulfovibrio sp.]